MNRTSLDENSGMLFIYADEKPRTYWMKNTLIPLDMIFINSEKEIVAISENTKTNQIEETYSSIKPAQYVLEVNGGWCGKNGVEVGDVVSFD